MNKRKYTLAKLLSELQSAEDLMIQAKATMVSSTHHSSGPRPGAGRKKVTNQVAAKDAKGKKKRNPNKKQTGKCFKCGQKGHWKQDCPKRAKAIGMHQAIVVESCLALISSYTLVIDTRATDHICFDPDLIQMDVKTAFLNDSLEETIYMEQPEGYTVKGKELMFYIDCSFYRYYTSFQREMSQLTAVACLSVAAKVEETQVPLLLDLQVEESKYVFRGQDDSENGASCALHAPMEDESGDAIVVRRPHCEEIRVCKEPTLGILEEMRECDTFIHCRLIIDGKTYASADSRLVRYLPSVIAVATIIYVIREIP
ncbi:uncharacterized protein LOC121774324 [Salvia splendens]|uniref:uncharacterized protein LOC121774324 n=1 Tax=Salvia splendens TaxID=180675 RepID=UPI001C25FE77|nr:uncharacterized protein LOC121774324 [Salvia splendens]